MPLTPQSEGEFLRWYMRSVHQLLGQQKIYGQADFNSVPDMPKLEYEKENTNENIDTQSTSTET